ncbi:MAG: hypothetical protein K2X99_06800, partial [Gemmatimonadaceae bacterium]|nr:hypothetical protein [Gemmatimonadaceae bacterium]
MRRSIALGALFLGLPLLAARFQSPPGTVVAHRGASWDAPEHTFAAYDQALAAGADYIEQDLQMTRDSVLVVLHDPTGVRTLRGAPACTGRIIDATWLALADCDAGSWFNARWPERARSTYAAERVPTLRAVFARYGRRTRYYIETKNPEEAPGMERQLVSLIREFKLGDRVLLQSFSTPSLLLLRDLAPDLPRVQLIGQRLSPDSLMRVAQWAEG